jgi:hypothetical protein
MMKLSEKISVSLSGIAIVISVIFSIITIYYQFFFISHQLAVSSYDIVNQQGGLLVAELTVSNTGNQPITISNIHFCLIDKDAKSFEGAESWTYVDTKVDNIYSDIVLSKALIALKPGEIKVLRLSSTIDFSESNPLYKNNSFILGIRLTTYTSNAEQKSIGIMPFWVEFTEKGLPHYPQRGNHFEQEHVKKFEL